MSELNTTGYALLGLLNRHPWSAYELTQFMRVSYLRAVWPRAESRLYEGPKNLVKLGFSTAVKELQGKRPRTIYSITPQGREALQNWLKTSGSDVVFEHEALLKLANCDAGELQDLQNIVSSIRQSTDAGHRELLEGLQGLVAPGAKHSSEQRFLINTLVNDFIYETMQARLRWLEFAEGFTREWVNLEVDDEKMAASRAHYAELIDNLKRQIG